MHVVTLRKDCYLMQTTTIPLASTPQPQEVMSLFWSILIFTLENSVLIGYNLFCIVVELCLELLYEGCFF